MRQTLRSGGGEAARRLDRLSRSLIAEAGLAKAAAAAAHTVLYTYLLGSVTLEESRGRRQSAGRFRAGLGEVNKPERKNSNAIR